MGGGFVTAAACGKFFLNDGVDIMDEEETRNAIIDMVKEIDRLDVLEYIKIIVADVLKEQWEVT